MEICEIQGSLLDNKKGSSKKDLMLVYAFIYPKNDNEYYFCGSTSFFYFSSYRIVQSSKDIFFSDIESLFTLGTFLPHFLCAEFYAYGISNTDKVRVNKFLLNRVLCLDEVIEYIQTHENILRDDVVKRVNALLDESDMHKLKGNDAYTHRCFNSERISFSKDVFNSKFVCDGFIIDASSFLDTSNGISHSSFIKTSKDIVGSSNIKNCVCVYSSEFICDSDFIFNSRFVNNSYFIFNSRFVNNSYFVNNVQNVSNCIFCSGVKFFNNDNLNFLKDDKGDYYLFNKKVSYSMFNDVKQNIRCTIDKLYKMFNLTNYYELLDSTSNPILQRYEKFGYHHVNKALLLKLKTHPLSFLSEYGRVLFEDFKEALFNLEVFDLGVYNDVMSGLLMDTKKK